MVDNIKDYYTILGLTPDASDEAIHKTYIKLAKVYHPDYNADTADRRMIELNQAYEVLSNPVKKKEYDIRFAKTQALDFTHAQENKATHQKRERVIKPKVQGKYIFRFLLLIVLWIIVIYLALYFIINIATMFVDIPTWLTAFFPQ